METRGDAKGSEEKSTYSVIAYPGPSLPAQYRNLVLSKWLRTLRHGNEYFKLIESNAYYQTYDRFIKTLLQRPGTMVRIAALSDDLDVVLGFSMIEGDTLHYVYVQHEQRNKGIAKSLVPTPISTITHLTKAGASIWNSKLKHADFNPFR